MTMETSVGPTVVVPGSADDPFSVHNQANQPQTVVIQDAPASSPATAPATPAASQPAQTAPVPAPKQLTQAEVDKIVQDRLREAQSGWDKRNAKLEADLRAEKEAREAAERTHRDEMRRAQLEGMPEHQRQAIMSQWQLEDRENAVKAKESAVTDYFANVERLRVFQQYAPFGVTEDDLLAISDPDKMESFAKDKKLAFFEAGGNGAAPSGSQNGGKPAAGAAPAGANAHYDAGGSPPAPQQNGVISQQGVDHMGANIKNMFASDGNPW